MSSEQGHKITDNLLETEISLGFFAYSPVTFYEFTEAIS